MSPGVLERNDDKVVATKITGDRGRPACVAHL